MSDFYIPPPETSASSANSEPTPDISRFELGEVAPVQMEMQNIVEDVQVEDVLSDAERLAKLDQELPGFEDSFVKLNRELPHKIRVSTAGESSGHMPNDPDWVEALYGDLHWGSDKSTIHSTKDGEFEVTDAALQEFLDDFGTPSDAEVSSDVEPEAIPTLVSQEEDLDEIDVKQVLLEINDILIAPWNSRKGLVLRGLGAALKAQRAVEKKATRLKTDSKEAFTQYVEKSVVDDLETEALLALKAHHTGELPKKGDVSKNGRRKILALVAAMQDDKKGTENRKNIMIIAGVSEADLLQLTKTESNETDSVDSAEVSHRFRKLALGVIAAGVVIGSLASYGVKNNGNSDSTQEVSLSSGSIGKEYPDGENSSGLALDKTEASETTMVPVIPETTTVPPVIEEQKPIVQEQEATSEEQKPAAQEQKPTTTSTVKTITTKPAPKLPPTTVAQPKNQGPVSRKYRLVVAKTDTLQGVLGRVQNATGDSWTSETFKRSTGIQVGSFIGVLAIDDCINGARLVQAGEGPLNNGQPAIAGKCVRE